MGARLTHSWGGGQYIPGDRWVVCARCKFDYRESETVVEENTDLRVCRDKCYDPVHPRDDINRDLDRSQDAVRDKRGRHGN